MKVISGKLTKIFICFSKHKTAAFKAAVLYFRDKINVDLTVVASLIFAQILVQLRTIRFDINIYEKDRSN